MVTDRHADRDRGKQRQLGKNRTKERGRELVSLVERSYCESDNVSGAADALGLNASFVRLGKC